MSISFTLKTAARNQSEKNIPTTAHGRARYTSDWFTHGRPRAINYDKETMTTKGALPC